MDPRNEDPSSTAEGMDAEEEKEKIWIIVEAFPQSWSTSFPVNSSCTIWRLIHYMESDYRNSRNAYQYNHIIKFLESFEEAGMLLFKGKDLMDHPDRTLQQWGVKESDTLIIRDKRPFSVSISMQEMRSEVMDVQIEIHDTVPVLKKKIGSLVGVPVENKRLCYVDPEWCKHHVIADDSVSLTDYGIMKEWSDSELSEYGNCWRKEIKRRIWLYTDNDPESELRHFSSMDVVGYPSSSSSRMEINVEFCLRRLFLCIAVESYYTVNQLIRMIREIESSEEICMLVFHWKNLLELGSSTLGDLGIKDKDKLVIPVKGPFIIFITISPSSFGQQQDTTCPTLELYVQPFWTVHTLKEKIKSKRNIPLKKQTLCCVREGFDNEECHLVMHDSMTLAAYGIMQGGHCIGLYYADDLPTEEDRCGSS